VACRCDSEMYEALSRCEIVEHVDPVITASLTWTLSLVTPQSNQESCGVNDKCGVSPWQQQQQQQQQQRPINELTHHIACLMSIN